MGLKAHIWQFSSVTLYEQEIYFILYLSFLNNIDSYSSFLWIILNRCVQGSFLENCGDLASDSARFHLEKLNIILKIPTDCYFHLLSWGTETHLTALSLYPHLPTVGNVLGFYP